eukprot:gene2808-1034_t
MGIQGLLPLLRDIERKTSVSEFHGKTVGIDGYCWLHKGVYGCAKDIVEGKKTKGYINYVIRRLNMLINYNITPVMVFDGGYLPAKASKEKERRNLRQENLKKAKAFLRAGNVSQANDFFQRCVEITPMMATEVIQACRQKEVLCIVAPYEADAQLAYLEMQGITQFTITEDSDLLIYGCKKVLFKMNGDGDGIFIDLAQLNKVKKVALESFTLEKFRHMCILSGCDYLPSVKGLGLHKAHKFLLRSTTAYKAIQLIKQSKFSVPDDYADDFRKADAVFKYQSVFDPRSKQIVRLNEVSETDDVTEEELSYAGPKMDKEKAVKIALGNLDPITGETLADFEDFVKAKSSKEVAKKVQTFIEEPKKHKDPNLHYSLDGNKSEDSCDETRLEKRYTANSESDSGDEAGTFSGKLKHFLSKKDDDTSPPEKSLQKISFYEKQSPQVSLGILYDDRNRKVPTASRYGHHSVFVKRKQHKFKNPFRVHEDNEKEENATKSSRYFSSCSDRKENDSISTNNYEQSNIQDENDVIMENCGNMESPPDSKRVKYSMVDYLDSQSKKSLKTEAFRLSDGDFPLNPPEEELTKSNVVSINSRKIPSSKDELPRLPALPFEIDNTCEGSSDADKRSTAQISLTKFLYTKNTEQGLNTRKSLFKTQKSFNEDSFTDGNRSSQDLSQSSNECSQEVTVSKRNSLGQETLHLSQLYVDDKEERENTCSSASFEVDEVMSQKRSVTHLETRSLSGIYTATLIGLSIISCPEPEWSTSFG